MLSRDVETRAPGWDRHALVLPRERAMAKLRAGRPLLHDEPVVLDLAWATDLFLGLAGEQRLDVGRLDLAAVLTEAFVQHADHVRQIAGLPGVDPEPIAELAEKAVRPLRRAYAARLGQLVAGWQRGYCPICGSSPSPPPSPSPSPSPSSPSPPSPSPSPSSPASPGQAGNVQCGACGCAWRATADEPAFRIELALPDEDA